MNLRDWWLEAAVSERVADVSGGGQPGVIALPLQGYGRVGVILWWMRKCREGMCSREVEGIRFDQEGKLQ
jgi:hypothetical protein